MELATEKQIAFMTQLGIAQIPGITKAAAREMIKAKLEEDEAGNGKVDAPVEKIVDKPVDNGFHLTPENVNIGALEAAFAYANLNPGAFVGASPDVIIAEAKKFKVWILNGQ